MATAHRLDRSTVGRGPEKACDVLGAVVCDAVELLVDVLPFCPVGSEVEVGGPVEPEAEVSQLPGAQRCERDPGTVTRSEGVEE